MLNVLLVEDDQDLALTIVQYLDIHGVRCDNASNGVSGLQLIQNNHYDVILLDLNLPRMDGLSVCREVRREGNDTSILMLTARDELSDKVDGFESGTDDYLVKPFELQEMLVRVRSLAKRKSGQVQRLSLAGLEMDISAQRATRDGVLLKLSPIAWRLLEKLMRESPATVSRNKLEEAVWGDDLPDSNSLKVHMHNLRKIVDKEFETSLIQTVSGRGFALREPSVD